MFFSKKNTSRAGFPVPRTHLGGGATTHGNCAAPHLSAHTPASPPSSAGVRAVGSLPFEQKREARPCIRTHGQAKTAQKAMEALLAVQHQAQVISVVEAVIEARPGLDHRMLEAFADRLRRLAWKIERGER